MDINTFQTVVLFTALFTCVAGVSFPDDLELPENIMVDEKASVDYHPQTTMNTTIVMAYSKVLLPPRGEGEDSVEINSAPENRNYRMGTNGYAYCFNMYAKYKQPVRISIWRWVMQTFDNFYSALEEMEYYQDLMENGTYSLVYMTETIYPEANQENTVCFNRAVSVKEDDFLGLTFGVTNPIPYNTEKSCVNDMINAMQTCDVTRCAPDTKHASWGSHDGDYNKRYRFGVGDIHQFKGVETSCKNYPVQAMVMNKLADLDYNDCELIQLTEQENAYSMTSHTGYPSTKYDRHIDDCWIIRSMNSSSKIHIQPVDMDLDPQIEGKCVFDKLTVIDPDNGNIMTKYCGSMTNMYVVSGAYCVIRFYTDDFSEHRGFNLHLRSIPDSMYKDHIANASFVWPWEQNITEQEVITTTHSFAGQNESRNFGSDFTMAEKIGVGIGIAALCLLVLLVAGVITYCICRSATNKKQKVQPTVNALPKQKTYESRRVSNGMDEPYYSGPRGGVYTIPEPRFPPPYHLAPISRSTPRDNPPPPYTEGRYRSVLNPVIEDQSQNNPPIQISWPDPQVTPVMPPKWSGRLPAGDDMYDSESSVPPSVGRPDTRQETPRRHYRYYDQDTD